MDWAICYTAWSGGVELFRVAGHSPDEAGLHRLKKQVPVFDRNLQHLLLNRMDGLQGSRRTVSTVQRHAADTHARDGAGGREAWAAWTEFIS